MTVIRSLACCNMIGPRDQVAPGEISDWQLTSLEKNPPYRRTVNLPDLTYSILNPGWKIRGFGVLFPIWDSRLSFGFWKRSRDSRTAREYFWW